MAINRITQNEVYIEMLKTEKTYNRHLTVMLDVYQANRAALPDGHIVHQVIAKLQDLKNNSEALLANVISATQPNVSSHHRNKLAKERIKILQSYFSNYLEYSIYFQQIQPLLQSQEIQNYDRAIKSELYGDENRLNLNSLLVEPIQRAPRYALLIDAILKKPDGLDRENINKLQSCYDIISKNLEQINRWMQYHGDHQSEHLSANYQLLLQLMIYQNERQAKGRYDNFFGIGGICREEKLIAVDKAIWALNGYENIIFSPQDIAALKDGRLGRLIANWQQQPTPNFFNLEAPKQIAMVQLKTQLQNHKQMLLNRETEYGNFFNLGYSKAAKIPAIEAFLNGENLSDSYRAILNNGRTGKMIAEWSQQFDQNAFTSFTDQQEHLAVI